MSKKISELIDTTELTNDDIFPIVQDDMTKKVKWSTMKDAITFSDNVISVASKITANTNYTIPASYIVGANEIEIYWNGVYLAKDENWEEVGTEGQASTTVKFGWDIEVGEELLIRKRGVSND